MRQISNLNYRRNTNQVKYTRFNAQRFGKRTPSSMQYVVPKTINNIVNNRNKNIKLDETDETDETDDDKIGVNYIIENCPSITVVRDFFRDQVKYMDEEDNESDDLNLN